MQNISTRPPPPPSPRTRPAADKSPAGLGRAGGSPPSGDAPSLRRRALPPETRPPSGDAPSLRRRALPPETCPPSGDAPSLRRRALPPETRPCVGDNVARAVPPSLRVIRAQTDRPRVSAFFLLCTDLSNYEY